MKKLTFIKTLLLTVILLVGSTSAFGQKTYNLVTSAAQLEVGAKYLIVSTNTTFVVALGPQASNNRTGVTVGSTTAAAVPNQVITTPAAAAADVAAFEITLGGSAGAWTLNDGVNGTVLGAHTTAGTNGLRANAGATFTINIETSNAATMTCVTSTNSEGRNNLRFNYNSGSPIFACYASGQTAVYLFKEVLSQNTVATPTFSPAGGNVTAPVSVSISCATDGATIKYSTDGDNPTFTTYTAPISVTSTTTITAMAIKAGMTDSPVATATYTFPTDVANIAAFNALSTNTFAKITNPVTVIYQNGQNLYVTDGNGSLLVYGNVGKEFKNGDVLTGLIGTRAVYGNAPQMLNPVAPDATAGTAVTPAVVTADYVKNTATLAADHSKFAQMKNVQFKASVTYSTTSTVNGTLTNDLTVRDNFRNGGSYSAGQPYNITGFINFYNGEAQFYPTVIELVVPETPIIIVAETSIPPMSAEVGKSATQTITVSGYNLTGNITLAITGTNLTLFFANIGSIPPVEGTVSATTVIVSYQPQADNGPHTATLTLSSAGAENVVFELNGTVRQAIPVPNVIITEVYGGGGNSGAPLKYDFVELYNTTDADVNISGWSLQYYSATGTSANVFAFPANSIIRKNNYALIQLASQADVGADLPVSPNFIDTRGSSAVNLSGTNGKIVLYTIAEPQALANATNISLIVDNANFKDYVAYGNATPVLGTALAALTNSTSAQRKMDGGEYVYTKDIGKDFTTGAPAPQAGPDPVGVKQVKADAFNVYVRDGKIMFNATAGELVDVYNVLGQKVLSSLTTDGLNTVPVNIKGIAVVKMGDKVSKVLIK